MVAAVIHEAAGEDIKNAAAEYIAMAETARAGGAAAVTVGSIGVGGGTGSRLSGSKKEPPSGPDTTGTTTISPTPGGDSSSPPGDDCPPPPPPDSSAPAPGQGSTGAAGGMGRPRVRGGKGDRLRESDNLDTALEQESGVSGAQDQNRDAVNETKKSKQNVKNRLRRIRCEQDYHDQNKDDDID